MRILIVRFSSIGDIVLTTPVIRCLAEQTGAELHFLTKRSFAGTLVHNPYLTRLWTIERDIREVAEELLDSGFTHLIDLHGNLRTLELKARLVTHHLRHGRRPPAMHTFNKLNWRKFLLTRLRVDLMPEVHIVDRYLATVRPLGVVNDGRGLDYFISRKEEVDPATLGVSGKYLALVIGAAHATKRLTEPQLVEICQLSRLPVILLGGPAEADLGERIVSQAGGDASTRPVVNACGRFPLAGSADLVRRAAAVITHDTGLMHIAAAFRKPIVSVWGNTVPALGMYPYLPGQEALERQRRQEVTGLRCRPCSKIGYAECPRGHFRCIRAQRAADIVSALP